GADRLVCDTARRLVLVAAAQRELTGCDRVLCRRCARGGLAPAWRGSARRPGAVSRHRAAARAAAALHHRDRAESAAAAARRKDAATRRATHAAQQGGGAD